MKKEQTDTPSAAPDAARSQSKGYIVFLGSCVVAIISGLIFVPMIFASREKEHPSFPFPKLVDLKNILFFTPLLLSLRLAISEPANALGDRILPRSDKWSASERELRVQRFGHCVFKGMYFLFSSSVGLTLLLDAIWTPPALGGQGDTSHCFIGWPHHEHPSWLVSYYSIQMSYHLQGMLYQIVKSRHRSDFAEMMLHHIVTLFLIMFSYLFNFFRIGTLVFLLHDLGDVFSYFIKSVVDTDSTGLILTAYGGLLLSWGYFRLYVYPFHVIWSCFSHGPRLPGLEVFPVMLVMLLFLHCYWYSLFLHMGYAFYRKGEAEDIVDNAKLAQTTTKQKAQ
mmetsp:Transcript_132321/g.197153  ORF Transcript_132321/g.197153 Transcript_132321/m.197153 type:complete len:337 (+) Transcript_132321:74-1084(+)